MVPKRVRDTIFSVYFALFMILIYGPLIVLLVFSFNDSTILTIQFKGFTLKWYGEVFDNPGAISSILNSLLVASATAFLATLGGTMAAFALVRHRFSGRTILQWFMLLPMVLPNVIIGLALFMFFSMVGIDTSLLTVVLGHTLAALPFATLVMVARLIGFDRSLEEAAMDLGADELTTFRKVTFPLIMPGIIASAFLGFTNSFGDVSLAFFLIGYEQTIPIFIYGILARRPAEFLTLPALSMITLSFAFVLAIILTLVSKK